MPAANHKISLPGPAGTLEGRLEGPEDAPAIAVVCHPHPQFGGTMDNKVVYSLARTLEKRGLRVLRFNFRGVGASSGRYAEGQGEVDDALAARAWLSEQHPDRPCWLAGFSFGGGVAITAAARSETAMLITVAPSLRLRAHPDEWPTCPWLNLHAEDDDVVPCAETSTALANLAHPPLSRTLAEGGHFFHGQLSALSTQIERDLDQFAS